jgi:hypothetical protein
MVRCSMTISWRLGWRTDLIDPPEVKGPHRNDSVRPFALRMASYTWAQKQPRIFTDDLRMLTEMPNAEARALTW